MADNFLKFSIPRFYSLEVTTVKNILGEADKNHNQKTTKVEIKDYLTNLINDIRAAVSNRDYTTAQILEKKSRVANDLFLQYDILTEALETNDLGSSDSIDFLANRGGDSTQISADDVRFELVLAGAPKGFMDLPDFEPPKDRRKRIGENEFLNPSKEELPFQEYLLNKLGNQDGKLTSGESSVIHRDFIFPLQRAINEPSVSLSIPAKKLEGINNRINNLLSKVYDIEFLRRDLHVNEISISLIKNISEERAKIATREHIENNSGIRFLQSRAVFNALAKNGDINLTLLEYGKEKLPHRYGITDPEEIKRLDQMTIDLATSEKLNIYYSPQHIDAIHQHYNFCDLLKGGFEEPDNLNKQELDFSSKILVASGLITMAKNQPDLLAALDVKGEPFEIFIVDDKDGAGRPFERRGSSSSNHNDNDQSKSLNMDAFADTWNRKIYIGIRHLWDGDMIDNPNNGNTVLHEYLHYIDSLGQTSIPGLGSIQGIPNNILERWDNETRSQFTVEKERLFTLYNQGQRFEEHFNYAFEDTVPIPGVKQIEFLPTTAEYFFMDPKTLYDISPTLYEIYKKTFNQDPLHEKQFDGGGNSNGSNTSV